MITKLPFPCPCNGGCSAPPAKPRTREKKDTASVNEKGCPDRVQLSDRERQAVEDSILRRRDLVTRLPRVEKGIIPETPERELSPEEKASLTEWIDKQENRDGVYPLPRVDASPENGQQAEEAPPLSEDEQAAVDDWIKNLLGRDGVIRLPGIKD